MLFEYILNKYTVFLTHIDTRQLPAYIEQKHYHVGKKIAYVGFVWQPNTLFQPSDISV